MFDFQALIDDDSVDGDAEGMTDFFIN